MNDHLVYQDNVSVFKDNMICIDDKMDDEPNDKLSTTTSNSNSTSTSNSNKKHESNLKIYSDKILGKGSYSKVFPGRYKDKLVAVKIIATNHLEPTIAKQLGRELDVIRLLQKNNHVNIATYYKIFHSPDKMVIVMELCSGGELKKHIEKGLSFETVKDYFNQILRGYKHLLTINIIHRDIKSANILVTGDKKTIKFIDFGLSKIFKVDLNSTILGSPLYMAPEVLNNNFYNSKADIWSIGVLLYEMVYGVPPLNSCKTIEALKISLQNNKIKYPSNSIHNLYPVRKDLIQYIKSLLELDPMIRRGWASICDADWLKNESITDINTNINISGSQQRHIPKRISNTFTVFSIDDEFDEECINTNINTNTNTNINTKQDTASNSPDDTYSHNLTQDEYPNPKKRSAPISIAGAKQRSESRSYEFGFNRRGYQHERQQQNSYGKRIDRLAQSPTSSKTYAESLGSYINEEDININDLSVIDNNPNVGLKQYQSDSGLVDIDDVDSRLIGNIPDRTTAYEYFSQKCVGELGSYLYSCSAPVTSTFMERLSQGLDTVTKAISPHK